MLRTDLWNESASRVVLDHRSREAHPQLERMERQGLLAFAAICSNSFPAEADCFVLLHRHLGQRAARAPNSRGAAEQSACCRGKNWARGCVSRETISGAEG